MPVFRDEKGDPSTRASPITFASFFAVIYDYEALRKRYSALEVDETVRISERYAWGAPESISAFFFTNFESHEPFDRARLSYWLIRVDLALFGGNPRGHDL